MACRGRSAFLHVYPRICGRAEIQDIKLSFDNHLSNIAPERGWICGKTLAKVLKPSTASSQQECIRLERETNRESHGFEHTASRDCAYQIADEEASAILSFASTRREPPFYNISEHSEQFSHRICTTNFTLLIRVRVEERRKRNDHIRCNQQRPFQVVAPPI